VPGDNGVASFHGRFKAQPVAATIDGLPDHSWVRVRFKLLTFGTWDGSNRAWGPDLWSMQLRGGPQLFLTSFSNMRPRSPWYVQAFPDDYPYGVHDAFTGAGPLGHADFPRGDDESNGIFADACYPVEVVFPHRGASLTLDFAGIYSDPSEERQDWGIADLRYETTTAPAALDDVELYRLWGELASPESPRANAALWKLVSGGDKAARFLSERIDALRNTDPRGGAPTNSREALRLRRADKVLRIVDSRATRRTREALTAMSPEYNGAPERRN